MGFGEKLKELRIERRFTQEELAKALGCSQAMIARWESNENQPTEEHIVKAAKFFGVSTDYILGLSDY